MSAAKLGDTVLVHYTGKLDDGSVFDTSQQRGPLRVTLGETSLIPGFRDAVVGMEQGESKTVTLEPESAYGPRREEMIFEFDRSSVPSEIDPEVGREVQLQSQSGQPVPARVVELSDQTVKIDANHPLAGKQLIFDIELVEIAPIT